jgi:hypothetical protein
MKAKVITQFNKDMIKQYVEYSEDLQVAKYNMIQEVMNLKDKGVRDALIALGWSPPGESLASKAFDISDEWHCSNYNILDSDSIKIVGGPTIYKDQVIVLAKHFKLTPEDFK